MEGVEKANSPPSKPSKFSVYQNPALSAALTARSIKPSKSTFIRIFSASTASVFALCGLVSRENGFIDSMTMRSISHETAYLFAKTVQVLVTIIVIGNLCALINAISLRKAKVTAPSKETKDQPGLTIRQLGLLGIKPKGGEIITDSSKRPPKGSTPYLASSPSDVLVPLHQAVPSLKRSSHLTTEKSNASSGSKLISFSTPSKSSSPVQASSVLDRSGSTPWSTQRVTSGREITSEEKLEKFLADVDEKIKESAGKLTTPPPSISGFGITTPNTVRTSANTSSTRSTPLRPVRMSPGSQKFNTPPKKGEGEFPPPMSVEESIEAFERLGIYPQIEQWRDLLRQWFSSVLLNPLLGKIETSHIKVMQTAAKLGISISINQIGNDSPAIGTPTSASPNKEWQPLFTLDEDGILHQLRAGLVQSLDGSMSKLPSMNLQQSSQQNSLSPLIQECVDAITENQRLIALMKGEWVKGLLPQSSVRADYTVQRIHELAEGTCVKNYEYLRNGEVYDKKNKKWSLELPTDSHMLLYLFCAFLEHPKWTLHVDPTSYGGAQYSKNPLFLGVLPWKESFPEKYIAVISNVPSTLHLGASVLAVGRQGPPIFALYSEKKLQFSLQGRTALWDSILLLCHRIKVGYGGIVRGVHIGSPALGLLQVIDTETED